MNLPEHRKNLVCFQWTFEFRFGRLAMHLPFGVDKLSSMHLIYIHASCHKMIWHVQYFDAKLNARLRRTYRCTNIERVRTILHRYNCTPVEWGRFEFCLEHWGIGTCFLNITDEQFDNLKDHPSRFVKAPRRS